MPIDVLCAGLIVADHVCAPIAAFPPAGGLVTTDRLELTIGGCAANVAVDLAKLGLSVSIAGRIGNDFLGRFVTETLSGQGVHCETMTVSETAQTSATLVVNVAGEDRRFLHAVGANAEFTGREIAPEALRRSRAIYVGGFGLNPALSGENVAALFRLARESGAMTVLDVVVGEAKLLPPMLQAALPETDVFLPNIDEARLICGETEAESQAKMFREWGAKSVIITRGGEGAVLLSADGLLRSRAYPVRCVDGTGGGDAFVAGFLYGRLQGASPRQSLAYGSAMGASCVRAMGATTGVYGAGELEEYIRENPLAVEG